MRIHLRFDGRWVPVQLSHLIWGALAIGAPFLLAVLCHG